MYAACPHSTIVHVTDISMWSHATIGGNPCQRRSLREKDIMYSMEGRADDAIHQTS